MKKRTELVKICASVMICSCILVSDNSIGATVSAAEAPQVSYADTILSVYPNSAAAEYQALGMADVLMESGIQVADESEYMRFVSVLDGVNVSLDYGKWYDSLDYFHVINQNLFSVYTTAGTVYSFPAYTLAEKPELRITASFGDAEASWILQEDAGEQIKVVNLKGSDWKPESLTKYSNMAELCIARASLQYLYGDANHQDNQWYFWQTIENAITVQDPCEYKDTLQGAQWPMETWLVDAYVKALFPDCEVKPELPEKLGSYAAEFGQYSLNKCDFSSWLTGEIGMIQKISEDMWIVGIHLTDWKDNCQESYVAVLVENEEYQEWTPFEYEISGMYRFSSNLMIKR